MTDEKLWHVYVFKSVKVFIHLLMIPHYKNVGEIRAINCFGSLCLFMAVNWTQHFNNKSNFQSSFCFHNILCSQLKSYTIGTTVRNWSSCRFRYYFSFIYCTFGNTVLDQLQPKVSDSKHSALCRRCLFKWKQTMHQPSLKAFGWNDRRNPWTAAPVQMEMNTPRCVRCAEQWGMGIRERLWGFLAFIFLCLQEDRDSFCMLPIEGHHNWQSRQTTQHSTHGSPITLNLLSRGC